MQLPPFQPKPWIVEVTREYHTASRPAFQPETRSLHTLPKIAETDAFLTKEEADAYAAVKSQVFDSVTYKGKVREATPRDLAQQRLQEIAEALAKELEATILAEEKILAYDTSLHGQLDFSTPIQAEIEAILENYPPEEQEPVRNGWVGSNGLP